MPVTVKNQTYYRTTEVCKITGISRSTLLRWLAAGIIKDASHRDRRGWRLFAQADTKNIKEVADHIT